MIERVSWVEGSDGGSTGSAIQNGGIARLLLTYSLCYMLDLLT